MPHRGSVGRRDALSIVGTQLTLLLSSLVVQSLLGWLLLPEGRGLYAIFAVVGALMPVLCAFGLDRSIHYQVMSGRLGLGEALGSILAIAAVASTLGVMLSLCLAGFGPLPAFVGSESLWFAGLALVALTSGYTFLPRLLLATRRFREYLAVTLVQALSNVVLVLVLVVVLQLRTPGAIAAFAASYGAGAVVSFRWLYGAVDNIALASATQVPAIRRYAVKYYPALVGHAVDFNAGVLMLGALATNRDVGLYAALWALMGRFLMLALALQETVLPRVAADHVGRPVLVAQLSRLAVAGTTLITLVFCLVSKPVLSLLLSPAFASAADLAWWIAPGLILHSSSSLLMSYFEGTNRPGVVSLAIWAGLLSNICLIVVFYPRMGLPGAALALSLGMAVRFMFLGFEFRRSSGTSWRGITIMGTSDARLLFEAVAPLLRLGMPNK